MIPQWLSDKIANPPMAGGGIHAWLFSCARNLHAHMSGEQIAALLTESTRHCGRLIPEREILCAVRNSYAVSWQPAGAPPLAPTKYTVKGKGASGAPAERWPERDAVARACRIVDAKEEGVTELYDLWELSPSHNLVRSVDDWMDVLFNEAEWLCLASGHPATARTRRSDKWTFGAADDCDLVVPSPMTGPSGIGQDGRTTHRCLGNTGARRWLVVEFDDGTLDQQAALHWHLDACAIASGWPRLTLVLHSAGKSLHGWYGPITDEEVAREIMAYAVTLGADPATWTRCQLVRLPEGMRNGVKPESAMEFPEGFETLGSQRKQAVYYFAPHQ